MSFNKNKITMAVPRLLKKYIERRINSSDADIVFAPIASRFIALCNFNKPVIYLSDTTYHLMVNYYFKASEHDISIGNYLEKQTLKKASSIIFSNQWAAEDAISYYGIEKTKIKIIPFGSNLINTNYSFDRHPLNESIKLLFIGASYNRKGGNIAIETTKWLNEHDAKHNFTIDMVGMNSIKGYEMEPNVNYHGFIDKNTFDGMERIKNLYKNADIFILPTTAECCSMTYQEASCFALPIITYKTGGTSTVVKEGTNGFLIEQGSTPEEFGRKIIEMINPELYLRLCKSTFSFYNTRLNWDAWLNDFECVMDSVIQRFEKDYNN